MAINGKVHKLKIGSIIKYDKLKNLKANFLGFKDKSFSQVIIKARNGQLSIININEIIDTKSDPLYSNWNFEDDIWNVFG